VFGIRTGVWKKREKLQCASRTGGRKKKKENWKGVMVTGRDTNNDNILEKKKKKGKKSQRGGVAGKPGGCLN